MTSKTIKYKGHLIEVLRYAGYSAVNGRELRPMWNAAVDGERIQSYTMYLRSSAVAKAKQQIDSLEAK